LGNFDRSALGGKHPFMSDRKTTYVPWPTEDNYERFAKFCGDAMPETFFEYANAMQAHRERS
jgi:hypothetical protein